MCHKSAYRMVWINNPSLDVGNSWRIRIDYPYSEARRRVKDITSFILIQMIQRLKVKNCAWFRNTSWQVQVSKPLSTIPQDGLAIERSNGGHLFTSMATHSRPPAEFTRLLLMHHGLSWKMLGMRLRQWATNYTTSALKMGSTALQTCSSTCLPNHLGNR